MKVDFIILGAQKCGTTTLFEALNRHPALEGAQRKEPHFFSASADWRRDLPRYEALFAQREGAMYFEASTSYTFYPHRKLELWEDLYSYNPQMKFIYIVRAPIDRIISAYMHRVARGFTRAPLEEALRTVPLLLDPTRYHTQITPFIRRFGRSQVLLIDFDDLTADLPRTAREVAAFLGVCPDRFGPLDGTHLNPSVGGAKLDHRLDRLRPLLERCRRIGPPAFWEAAAVRLAPQAPRPKLTPAQRRMILHMLDAEITGMERLMDRDLAKWRQPGPPPPPPQQPPPADYSPAPALCEMAPR